MKYETYVIFVYSAKHIEQHSTTGSLGYKYSLPEQLPTFKDKEYTNALYVGKKFDVRTAQYFEIFDDAIVVGIGPISEAVPGKLKK